MSYNKALMQQARDAFAKHVLRKSDDEGGRWVLQRRYRDGKDWDNIYWTEIISLEGGMIYVGGDIDFVIFAHYSDKRGDHRAKVRWMGDHTDFSYYVHQKASIGSGYQLIDKYCGDAARETVEGWRDDLDLDDEHDQKMHGKIEGLLADTWLDWNDEHAVYNAIAKQVGHDWLTDCGSIGTLFAPRLYFAYAALQRLCAIWDAQADTKNGGDDDDEQQQPERSD